MAMLSQIAGEKRMTQTAMGPGSIIGLALTMALGSLGVSLPYVALPTLSEAFGVSLQAVQWIVTTYLLAVTTLVVGVGKLGDMFGPRNVLLAGSSLYLLATVACAAAPTFWMLLAGRALQGAGAAALIALTLVLARQTVGRDKMGRIIGLLGTMSAVGTALGPTLGGALTAGFGWRSIFLALIPVSAISLALILFSIPSAAAPRRSSAAFDGVGTLLLGLSVALYALALCGVTGGSWSGGLFLLAIVSATVFVFVEQRAEAPLVPFALMRDAKLVAGLTGNILTAAVMMATLVVGPFYLSRGLGLDVVTVGVIVSVGPIIAAISGVPAGFVVDKFGARAVLVAGLAQLLVGCSALAMLTPAVGVSGYVAALAVLTSGYQLFLAANNTAVMLGASEEQRGVISGVLTLSRNLGLATGASLMGGTFAALIDGSAAGNTDNVARAMNITFAFAGGFILIALALVIRATAAVEAKADER
ncbi:MAG: MFS transporter [Hyphomicrobiaceae bacterium]